MTNRFLAQADQGRNEFWRYLVTILAVIFASVGIQLFVAVIAIFTEGTTDLTKFSPMTMLLISMVSFPVSLIVLWAGLRGLHKRPPISLINSFGRVRWGRILFSALLWLGLSALSDLVLALINPANYQWTFDLKKSLPYFLFALILIPIQTSTEELVFRGYLTQWVGRYSKAIWLPLIAPSIVFMLLHSFNPEVGAYGILLTMPVYLGIGLLLAWLTLRSEGIELALGLHAANNLYASIAVTFPSSSLPSPAFFTTGEYNPATGLVVFIIAAAAYLTVLYLTRKKWMFPLNITDKPEE